MTSNLTVVDRPAGDPGAQEIVLEYVEAASLLKRLFAWHPGPFSSLLIRALSKLARPLEHGSLSGRRLEGEPHRPSCVIAGRLTVFVMSGPGYLKKVLLAARLRHDGPLNILDLADARSRESKRRSRADRLAFRRGDPARELALLGLGSISGAGSIDLSADPLALLIEIQRHSEMTLTLVPVAEASHQFTPDAPPASVAARLSVLSPVRLVRKAASLARLARTGGLKNCSPVALADIVSDGSCDRPGESAAVRTRIAGAMESEQRACTGPRLEPVREVKRRALADPVLCSYMKDYALEHGFTAEEVLDEARGYLDEISSDYRVGVVRWFARFVDFLFDRFLEGLEVDGAGIRYISECDTRKRLVLVCSHKSYLDPLLIGYSLFRSGLVPPQQAAGLNLSFWPVGWLLRHSGAFYLRRSFRGETLYREVFSAYVRYLLAENYVSVLYIEGTRSRDGKLAPPRTGFLGVLAESLSMGVCQEIELLPVYLGYDKVPEEGAHVREMSGGGKVGESVRLFARIYNSVNTRLGKAYVRFGRPVSMSSSLRSETLEGLAGRVCREINRITPLTARSLAAAALLGPGDEWVSAREVITAAASLLEFASRKGVRHGLDLEAVTASVEWFETEGRVRKEARGGIEGYLLEGESRRYLLYNSNMVSGHFIAGSLAARGRMAGGSGDTTGGLGTRDDTGLLWDLLRHETVMESPGEVTDDYRRPDSRGGPGEGPLSDTEAVLASFSRPVLEGYLVAVKAVRALRPGEKCTREEYLSVCFEEGGKMLADSRVTGEESLSRVTFRNALKAFEERGLAAERRRNSEDGERVNLVERLAGDGELGALEEQLISFL